MNRNTSRNRGRRIALSAVLGAFSLVLLYGAALAPSGRIGLTAAAGLLPAAAVVSSGLSAGFLCYGGTALLAFFLLADKNIVLLYLLFFGLYPMMKGVAERTGKRPLEWGIKFLFFNAAFTLLLWLLKALFLERFSEQDGAYALAYLVGNPVFLAYDIGFSKVIGFYQKHMGSVLRKG